MNVPLCFLLRWERRRWRTLGSCWRLIMPNWRLMTSESSESHIEVPFFYLPVSVHMGVPDCKAMWINDLNVRLWNKSSIPTVLRHPQETNNRASVRAGCDRLCRAERRSWTVRLAKVKLKDRWSQIEPTAGFFHNVLWETPAGMFCGLMWRSNATVSSFYANLCIKSWVVSCILGLFARVCPCHDLVTMVQSN